MELIVVWLIVPRALKFSFCRDISVRTVPLDLSCWDDLELEHTSDTKLAVKLLLATSGSYTALSQGRAMGDLLQTLDHKYPYHVISLKGGETFSSFIPYL